MNLFFCQEGLAFRQVSWDYIKRITIKRIIYEIRRDYLR